MRGFFFINLGLISMAEQIFTSPKRKDREYIYLKIVHYLLATALFLLFVIAWLGIAKFPFFLWIYIPFILVNYYYRVTRLSYINEINIDTENRIIRFSCYRFSTGTKEFTKPFDEVKIEVVQYLFPRKSRNPIIYFFKNKPGDFYLSAAKDGFSRKTMNEIAALLTALTTLVKK